MSISSRTPESPIPEKFDVVVSGEGPFGLLCAHSAAKSNKSVLLIAHRGTNYEDYGRVQRVFIWPFNRDSLLGMLGDKLDPLKLPEDNLDRKFLTELGTTTIAIKDIERFIKRRLDELKKNGNRITILEQSEITSINLKAGTLKTKTQSHEKKEEERSFEFDCCVDAGGSGHPATKVLNKCSEKPLVLFRPVTSPKHPFHALISVTIKRKDGKPLELPENKQFIADSTSRFWGMSLETTSKSFDGKKVKAIWGGEVPEKIYQLISDYNRAHQPKTDQEHVQKEAADIVKQHVQAYFKRAQLNLDAELEVEFMKPCHPKYKGLKDRMRLQSFTTDLHKANVAVVKIGDKIFVLGGNAYGDPDYQLGNGLNFAIIHANRFKRIINGTLSTGRYNLECNLLSKGIEYATWITNFNSIRHLFGWGAENFVTLQQNMFVKSHQSLLDRVKSLTPHLQREMKGESHRNEETESWWRDTLLPG